MSNKPKTTSQRNPVKQVPKTVAFSRKHLWWIAGGVALALVAAGGVGALVGQATAGSFGTCNAEQVANRVLPSVVTVFTETGAGAGNGSGQVISPDGYILTNDHVIAAAATEGSIRVRFANGATSEATLTGRATALDLAVIKIDQKNLSVIAIGDSESMRVGQPVVALGAPLGLTSSVTQGIVSALGREVRVPVTPERSALVTDAIQTDAAINPGNSGGALVNCSGQLIGVNTAIATVPNAEGGSSSGSVGIGFAIPSVIAMHIAGQLIETGKYSVPFTGIIGSGINQEAASELGIRGALLVLRVESGSPAEQAGVRRGDLLTNIGSTALTSADTLYKVTLNHKVGDTITITYLRDGERAATNLVLAEQAR